MMLHRALRIPAPIVLLGVLLQGQEVPVPQLSSPSARKPDSWEKVEPPRPQSIALTVPAGTPLQLALDHELRVLHIGQPIQARVVQSVYAFDQVVIPVGAIVTGRIAALESLTTRKRTLAALNADFTPARRIEVNFDDLVLPNGTRMPLETTVTPGSGQVLQFVTAAEGKKNKLKDAAGARTRQARQQAKQEWDNAMKELRTPGRMHRVERFLEDQLPVHRQFLPVGTVYFAELKKPLDFGSEVMTRQMAQTLGGVLPSGSVVHAWLSTALTSASAHKGDDVEAVLSKPLFDEQHQLVLPQGSLLKGTVRQVRPARRLKRNGQLRIEFRELVPPEGVAQKVEATLEGVQAGKSGHVKLDAEGGAEATTSKTRYLTTGLSLALAAASARTDNDAGHGGGSTAAGDPGSRVAGGATGFKLVGIALGFAVRSRAFGYGMGAYGAGRSLYSNFLARGTEVVFPRNTAMEVGLGKREGDGPPNSSEARVPASIQAFAPAGR